MEEGRGAGRAGAGRSPRPLGGQAPGVETLRFCHILQRQESNRNIQWQVKRFNLNLCEQGISLNKLYIILEC